MSKIVNETMARQLEELLSAGHRIQLEGTGVPSPYEVTIYYWHEEDKLNTHGHFGGATLAAAVSRAHCAMVRGARMPDDKEDRLEQPGLTVGRRTDGFFVLSFTSRPGESTVMALDVGAASWLASELCFHLSRRDPPPPVEVRETPPVKESTDND